MSKLTAIDRIAAGIKLAVFDFDGVFTDNTVYVSKDGSHEHIRCYRGDGLGLRRLGSTGVKTYVLSTEISPVVGIRCRKMGVDYQQGLEDKAKTLEGLVATLGISLDETLYLGNDINDSSCLEIVGVPVIVADAAREVEVFAKYQTQKRGGFGAVREVCDWVVECKKRGT